jgi:ribosomal protein L21E
MKFEKGERVRLRVEIHGWVSAKVPEGETGTVREVKDGIFGASYEVKFDNGEQSQVDEKDLEPA